MVEKRTSNGNAYKIWEDFPPVPRIYDQLLDCALYIYPSARQEQKGSQAGGSGFLVKMDSGFRGLSHFFAVTARHVVEDGTCGVIRLNTHDGVFDVIPISDDRGWVCSVEDDLAVAFVEPSSQFKYKAVPDNLFLTRQDVIDLRIGPGSEAAIVGRFVNHEGRQRNLPCVRCGNVAMMADEQEKVRISEKPERFQEAFLVELHTKCGYSGSAVFLSASTVHFGTSHFNVLEHESGTRHPDLPSAWPRLLGVHMGQVRDTVSSKVKADQMDTGMAIVIPSWRLAALLKAPKLLARMEKAKQDFLAPSPTTLESVNEPAKLVNRKKRKAPDK